ncbi:MAG: hypothetical protein JWO58_1669 [Chitinophagaceae bacterium]|nr:hypothetical protein [Chitinophagaceae bacterium]
MNGKLLMDLAWSKSIEVYHPDICHILRMSANPVQLATGLGFAEGLLWHKGGYLLFSDLIKNKIFKYTKQQGLEVFLDHSGLTGEITVDHSHHIGSNAIAYDQEGNLVFCQQGNHAIARLKKDGSIETVVNEFEGIRLNSPNDLVSGPDGSIYFTDPPYGLRGQEIRPDIAQPVAGVYRWFNGMLELMAIDFYFPNGICFSPDYHYLYVGSTKEEERMIRRYEVENGKLKNGSVFIQENANGIRTDKRGNLFLATAAGVRIYSPEGIKLGMIKIPSTVTSVCVEGNTLYIATPHKLYKFALRSK